MCTDRVAETDEGFSLIEVLVALTLVIITMASVGTYLIRSFGFVAHQRNDQVAAQLANTALEQVRALKGSSLAGGRGKGEAYAQFGLDTTGAALSGSQQPLPVVKDYLTDMTPAWDPYASTNDGSEAPISTATLAVTVDATTYERTVYLGECEVDLGSDEGVKGGCLPAVTKGASEDATKYLKFYRAVVLVTWPDRLCAMATCDYVTSTLISRATDPTFDVNRPSPVINKTGPNPIYFYLNDPTNYTIPVYGGALPVKWTTKPQMPDGLTVNQDGVVTGTPTRLQQVVTSGTVTDATTPQGRTTSASLTFIVVAPPTVTAPASPKNHVAETVNLPVVVNGGTTATTCSLSGQPSGISLASVANPRSNIVKGSYGGPLTAALEFTVRITCTDRPRSVLDRRVSITYKHTFYPVVQLTPPANQTITMGAALNATATASGGDQQFTYSATGLPPGVTINATTGVVSGVPTASGRFVPTIKVTDSIGGTGGTVSNTFVVIVQTSSLVFTSPALNAADKTSVVNTPTSMTFTTNAGLLALLTNLSASGLPPGMGFSALTGTISGTPTTAGTYTVTVLAKNPLTNVTSSNYTFLWTIQ